MNLIILKDSDFIDNRIVRIHGRRFEHLRMVNKVKKDHKLSCGLVNDKIGTGVIT
ncbi:MAG: 16S rRNA (uracil(1498)-N(3))-methyltransferase, partial [Desulfobacula sp.]|nr:16S rRNA (uracil(1498)-N(3))-methyltransferase [Desulfobacula sp.]